MDMTGVMLENIKENCLPKEDIPEMKKVRSSKERSLI